MSGQTSTAGNLVNGDPIDDVVTSIVSDCTITNRSCCYRSRSNRTSCSRPSGIAWRVQHCLNVISIGSGFTGEVAVQNLSSETLKGWEASFDFAGDINSIWNGQIVNQSGSRYTVRGHCGPDVSRWYCHFGFNGTPGGHRPFLKTLL